MVMDDATEMTVARRVTIVNERGLHARAAAKFVKLASVRNSESLAETAASAQEAGRKYINIASQLLSQDQK